MVDEHGSAPKRRVLQEDIGRVRVLTLARPEARNALDAELVRELRSLTRLAEEDTDVRALVLAAQGPAFCAGLDLKALASAVDGPMERHQEEARSLAALLQALMTSRLPIVAAVQGPVVAGGVGLLMASDLAVMARTATLGFTEARLGFVPALVAALLVRQVGEKPARDLLLRAHLVDAETAARYALVNEVVDDDAVHDRALALAAETAGNAPASIAETKRLLASLRGLALEDALRVTADVNAAARATASLREGVTAFLERRAPSWRES